MSSGTSSSAEQAAGVVVVEEDVREAPPAGALRPTARPRPRRPGRGDRDRAAARRTRPVAASISITLPCARGRHPDGAAVGGDAHGAAADPWLRGVAPASWRRRSARSAGASALMTQTSPPRPRCRAAGTDVLDRLADPWPARLRVAAAGVGDSAARSASLPPSPPVIRTAAAATTTCEQRARDGERLRRPASLPHESRDRLRAVEQRPAPRPGVRPSAQARPRAADSGARRAAEVARRRLPVVGLLRQRSLDHLVERHGQFWPQRRRQRRRVGEMGPELGLVAVAVVRHRARSA